MTTTDTPVQNLIINTMTQAQYATITPSSTELYMVTDSGSNYAFNNMSNVDSTGKKAVDNWGCPDYSAGISMGFPTKPTSKTTTTYTAPSAGMVYFWGIQRNNGGLIQIYVNNVEILGGASLGDTENESATFFVSKDDVIKILTNTTAETWEIKAQVFFPLKGEG